MVSEPTKIGKSATPLISARPFSGTSSPGTSSTMRRYYVRVGSLAEIHVADGDRSLRHGRRVIVRTPRGVELGQIAAPLVDADPRPPSTAQVLRPTTEQDELLLRRLDRHKREAVEACRAALRDSGSESTLLEVDQLFDGGTLVMHFLGPIDDLAQAITQRIVDQYESVVRSRHFAKLLHDGCGPGCGTAESGGCSTGGCSTGGCGLSGACAPTS